MKPARLMIWWLVALHSVGKVGLSQSSAYSGGVWGSCWCASLSGSRCAGWHNLSY